MNCRICQAPLADHLLGWCKECAEAQSRAAYLELLKLYLRAIFKGDTQVRMRQSDHGEAWHPMLLGQPKYLQHAWCGERISGRRREKWTRYPDANPNQICRLCREVGERLIQETRAEELSA
jgi:hypothetical protein